MHDKLLTTQEGSGSKARSKRGKPLCVVWHQSISLPIYEGFISCRVPNMHAGVRAFVGARLIPVTAGEIPDGVLVVDGGTIAAVGTREDVPIPAGAEVIDLKGQVLFPGLVCTHSHIGKVSGGDRSDPIQPDVRALDSVDVRDSTFEKARAGGLTLVNIMPGSGHLLSGQTIYLKLRDGNTIEDLAVMNADGSVAGGIKMANGTNAIREAPFPGTRGKAAALMRQKFLEAQAYQAKLADKGDDPPGRNLALEALVEVLGLPPARPRRRSRPL